MSTLVILLMAQQMKLAMKHREVNNAEKKLSTCWGK